MTGSSTETSTVVIERDIAFPPEKIWRALTQPQLLEEWLMKSDFAPTLGQRFQFRADWGSVDGSVLVVEPNRKLSYTWEAYGLKSVVTWTLSPAGAGTHLRMEHAGFGADQKQAYQGAQAGWRQFLSKLEDLLARTA
jgi:uncharacterized protein YndB with AHSA1/START domain